MTELVTATEQVGSSTVVSLGGHLGEDDPRRLVERLAHPARTGPLVVDLTAVADLAGAPLDELLWRLGRLPGHASTLLVHDDLEARRHLRRRTSLPVLPSIEVAQATRQAPPAPSTAPSRPAVRSLRPTHASRRPS